jgi:hypothetical protein
VFFGKIPKILRTSRKSKFRKKKSAGFSGFQDDAKIQPISGKSAGKNFRENRTFSEKISPKITKSGNSGKFRKKVQNVDFGKFNPRLQSVLKTHFKELKSIKKSENLGTFKNWVSRNARNFPEIVKRL